MRIEKLLLKNFRCFEDETFQLHHPFTLFVGDNGSGKTSILTGAAVALSSFVPREQLLGVYQPHLPAKSENFRLQFTQGGFQREKEFQVGARGQFTDEVDDSPLHWKVTAATDSDQMKESGNLGNYIGKISRAETPAPLIAYYGAGRAWLPSLERGPNEGTEVSRPMRWDGYKECLNERINLKDLNLWFRDEAAGRDDSGRWRTGFKTVRWAIQKCIPGAESMHWDPIRKEICVHVGRQPIPFPCSVMARKPPTYHPTFPLALQSTIRLHRQMSQGQQAWR